MAITSETFDFLIENRLQNSREWFLAHKKEYQKLVRKPLLELLAQLEETVLQIDPEIVTAPTTALSRVNRDTRFTKDKSLYRDVVWCVYRRDKKVYEAPCALFAEFSPMGIQLGCGYWKTPPAVMAAVREMVLADHPAFCKAAAVLENHPNFVLDGDRYKRPRYPDQPKHKQDWLELKSVAVTAHSQDFDLLFSDSLGQAVSEAFTTVAPIYHFLREAEDRAGMRYESL